MAADATASTSTSAKSNKTPGTVRVTSSGKIRYYVAYALERLQDAPSEPLILRVDSTVAMSRLISVAEIVKREYLTELDKKKSTRLSGLHQYNFIGYTDGAQLSDKGKGKEKEVSRPEAILDALSGSKHIVQRQLPWMSITLSIEPLTGQAGSYQQPLPRNLTKSAKTRAKKRARAEARQAKEVDMSMGADDAMDAEGAPGADETMDGDDTTSADKTIGADETMADDGGGGCAEDAMDTAADGATASSSSTQRVVKPLPGKKASKEPGTKASTSDGKKSSTSAGGKTTTSVGKRASTSSKTQPSASTPRTSSSKSATRTQPATSASTRLSGTSAQSQPPPKKKKT
ncbi:uncharacterized protein SCHCODRAFT_02627862 [Schizophyllum commune H4-8]|uniref:uncharacterized protein n=1 Tax=Schizophyllum commune (strain H4-8 / FGSC 9210) TaxID=578458 RepID=UPI0021600AC6|nr:uncharacterized protein SCHCODRAFT_02627862 [Schizophyllum commune H4-8]KAI5891003.1 hypothetical protein SCHCODRAFT_02627862 [Schizophyllum commune H4-8]